MLGTGRGEVGTDLGLSPDRERVGKLGRASQAENGMCEGAEDASGAARGSGLLEQKGQGGDRVGTLLGDVTAEVAGARPSFIH